ncbi:unnamed protein product [Meganyctiphanes norvegica]|uniref:Transposase n=1 Tax=Meganyctiphanes norvegica TaxID=48144 RepID=A0AAV2R1G5_MEGNR
MNDISDDLIGAIPQEEKVLYADTMITQDALAEQGNRKKRSGKIADPHKDDLNFELNLDWINKNKSIPDNFTREDIKVNGQRHIIFASDAQLELLREAERWYMDATFKIIKRPFYQLFSIHEAKIKKLPTLRFF